MKFEWDPLKSTTNFTKHGVSFEEAQAVFADPLAVIFDDKSHSVDELREIIIGYSQSDRLLLVAFTERSSGVCIISARLATRRERKDHEKNII